MTLDWLHSERIVYRLDVEPKGQSDQPAFATVDVTPTVEYAACRGWTSSASC